jgi:hypothetical protein
MRDFFSTTPLTAEQIEAERNKHPEPLRYGWSRLFETAVSLGYPDVPAARAADLMIERGSVRLRFVPDEVGWRDRQARWTERMRPELAEAITNDLL